jgi:hypothetical protein
MSDTTKTADEAVSNIKLIAVATWNWLSAHPVALAVVFFGLGFLIG